MRHWPPSAAERGLGPFSQSLDDLERAVRVQPEQQVTTQAVGRVVPYLEPEDVDRLRLLADPAGAGRLAARG